MIKIEKDGVYRAVRARSGVGERGAWSLVAIADEKNEKRTVTFFLDNTEVELREGQMFKIKDITSVKVGWKKDNRGAWVPDTTLSGVVEPIAYEGGDSFGDDAVLEGPSPWDDEDWGKLPL